MNFSNEIKKEAAALKVYIQIANAKLEGVDSTPSPPQNSSHICPTEGDGTVKNKSNVKKAVIAMPYKLMGVVLNRGLAEKTLSPPKIFPIAENKWARDGQRNSRVILSNRTQVNPTGRQS